MIGELIDGEIGGVDLNIGASIGVNSLVHQVFDSGQSGFSALAQFRAPGFRSLDARGDDFRPRRETYDHAGALERRAIRFVKQYAAAGRNHSGMRPVALGTSPAIGGQMRDRFAFEPAEVSLAMVGEDLRD